MFIAQMSPFPQGLFYNSDGAIASDITLVHQLDYNCDASRPRWTDGWNWYQHQEPDVNGHLNMIIDVRLVVNEIRPEGNIKKVPLAGLFWCVCVCSKILRSRKAQALITNSERLQAKKLPKAQMTQFGFAFLPVWGVGGQYTLSGNYRLPIFAMGPPPSKDDEVRS